VPLTQGMGGGEVEKVEGNCLTGLKDKCSSNCSLMRVADLGKQETRTNSVLGV
jgi:hypothetical protein